MTQHCDFDERFDPCRPRLRRGRMGGAPWQTGLWSAPATLLAGLLLLSGCASLTAGDCRGADWYRIGFEDGSRGLPVSRFGDHRKACAEVGVQPDRVRYSEGRVLGLQYFCTREQGYAEGEDGRSYSSVCPPHLEPVFMQGFAAGHDRFVAKQELRRLEQELAAVQEEVTDIRTTLDQGYRIDEAGEPYQLDKFEREAMSERLRGLGREEGRLEGEISTLQVNLPEL